MCFSFFSTFLLRFCLQMASSSIKITAATPAAENIETEPSSILDQPVIRRKQGKERSFIPAKLFDSASLSDQDKENEGELNEDEENDDEWKPVGEKEEDSDFEDELHVINAIQPERYVTLSPDQVTRAPLIASHLRAVSVRALSLL